MNIFNGYMTIYNNQKAVKVAQTGQKGGEQNIFHQKLEFSYKILRKLEQNMKKRVIFIHCVN